MKNKNSTFFSRLQLALVYGFEPLFNVFCWIYWIFFNKDITLGYKKLKHQLTVKMFSYEKVESKEKK